MAEPLDFGDDWEPEPIHLQIVTAYLEHMPEQGDWPWHDHCEGLAGGVLNALHNNGFELAKVSEGAAPSQSVPAPSDSSQSGPREIGVLDVIEAQRQWPESGAQ